MIFGVHIGQVTRRDDPENLGRVKVLIPGLIEPESGEWAWPLATFGGTAHRGHFEPPAVGATVGVLFVNGDVNRPCFIPGPWGVPGGKSDTPSGAEVEGDNRQLAVTEDEEWRECRDSRTGHARWWVESPSSSGDDPGSGLALVVDAASGEVRIARESASQKVVQGSDYRTAETSYQEKLFAVLSALASALSSAVDIAAVNAAGSAMATGLGTVTPADYRTDSTAYLTDEVKVP